jgi:hypothetical protein
MADGLPRHCERSDVSAVASAKAEAIQTASERAWIASSLSLLAMTIEGPFAF